METSRVQLALNVSDIETATRFSSDLSKISLSRVEEQLGRLGVTDIAADVADGFVNVAVGDDQIQRAIEVEIGKDAAETQSRERGDADP